MSSLSVSKKEWHKGCIEEQEEAVKRTKRHLENAEKWLRSLKEAHTQIKEEIPTERCKKQ